MPTCPHDHCDLLRDQSGNGLSWRCPTCGGVFATLPVLRRLLAPSTVNSLWQNMRANAGEASSIRCPSCDGALIRLKSGSGADDPLLDVCPACQAVWFDYGELKALPPLPKNPKTLPTRPLPQKAREHLALFQIKVIKEQARREGDQLPHGWQAIPFVLGFPIQLDENPSIRFPLATMGIVGFTLAASLWGLASPAQLVQFGLTPHSLSGTDLLLTPFTSLFLHGSILHLVGNLYFLLLFGPLAEDALGRKKFLALYFLAGVAGGLLHALLDPRSSTPLIGASGCISGVMAYAAFAFPSVAFSMRWFYRGVTISAETYVFLWFLVQFGSLFFQLLGIGDTSSVAHVAGALVGSVFFFRCGKPRRNPARRLDID